MELMGRPKLEVRLASGEIVDAFEPIVRHEMPARDNMKSLGALGGRMTAVKRLQAV